MFGFEPQSWQDARTQVHDVLVGRARIGKPIFYSDLAKSITAIHLDMSIQKDRTALGSLLGDVSRETHEQGIGMLSAMAVLKGEKNWPAMPFFRLARELGYRFTDREVFWVDQCHQIAGHYRDGA